jgi:hypothetical protein
MIARSAVVLAAAALAAGLAPGAAQAYGGGVTTVASGLDNPRGLDFSLTGDLYVAESGKGGTESCFAGPEGEACFGTTGAITKISHGKQQRVLDGLPSIGAPSGTNAIGPTDVTVKGGSVVFTVGLGADPARRAQLPETAKDTASLLRKTGHGVRSIADLGEYEATVNPDGVTPPDTNPTSVTSTPWGFAVADAGGNSLIGVSPAGKLSTIATFPSQEVEAPPFMGLPPGTKIPVQAVPTSVVQGPDGAFYVGQLTGFPFPVGGAKVYKVWPGGRPKVFAEGFTNIIDLDFGWDGSLYVLEIAKNGLPAGPDGALVKVGRDGSKQTIKDSGLTAPGGLAVKGDAAYVSNCGTCPGEGTVLRIPLR